MPTAGFETSIPATERPRTHALDRAATEIGDITVFLSKMTIFVYVCVCVCVCSSTFCITETTDYNSVEFTYYWNAANILLDEFEFSDYRSLMTSS